MTGIIYPGKRQFKRAIPACHGQKPWARHGQRKLAATLENLVRLKLVDISYDQWIDDARDYKDFYMDAYMKELAYTYQSQEKDFEIAHIAGVTTATSFGRKFYDICIKDHVVLNP